MSLANVYEDWFGGENTQEAEKVAEAEIEKIASVIDESGLTEDECEKLAEVCDALDEEGYEFEEAEEKLAAAAEVLDALEGDYEEDGSEDERVASEYDAAGRIMAQGFLDELGVEEDTREAAGGGAVKKVLKAIKGGVTAGPKSVRDTTRLVKNLGPKQYAKSVLRGKGSGAKMTRRELAKAIGTLGAGGVAGTAAAKRMKK